MEDSSCSSAAGLFDTTATVFSMLDHPAEDLVCASSTVFAMLDDPADLARASAVSRSWRQFASFQLGEPIYSAKSIRFQMGYARSPLRPEALVCDESEGQLIDDRNYVWTYTSPEFPVLQENVLQSFKLPRPVHCIGGVVKVELLGRVQKQVIDGLYYVCVSHVQILGKPLSRELGVVPRGNSLVLNYFLDPRTCGIPCSESSGDDAAAGGMAWRPGSGTLERREGYEGRTKR